MPTFSSARARKNYFEGRKMLHNIYLSKVSLIKILRSDECRMLQENVPLPSQAVLPLERQISGKEVPSQHILEARCGQVLPARVSFRQMPSDLSYPTQIDS